MNFFKAIVSISNTITARWRSQFTVQGAWIQDSTNTWHSVLDTFTRLLDMSGGNIDRVVRIEDFIQEIQYYDRKTETLKPINEQKTCRLHVLYMINGQNTCYAQYWDIAKERVKFGKQIIESYKEFVPYSSCVKSAVLRLGSNYGNISKYVWECDILDEVLLYAGPYKNFYHRSLDTVDFNVFVHLKFTHSIRLLRQFLYHTMTGHIPYVIITTKDDTQYVHTPIPSSYCICNPNARGESRGKSRGESRGESDSASEAASESSLDVGSDSAVSESASRSDSEGETDVE